MPLTQNQSQEPMLGATPGSRKGSKIGPGSAIKAQELRDQARIDNLVNSHYASAGATGPHQARDRHRDGAGSEKRSSPPLVSG